MRLPDKGVTPSRLSPYGRFRQLTAVERRRSAVQFAGADLPMSLRRARPGHRPSRRRHRRGVRPRGGRVPEVTGGSLARRTAAGRRAVLELIDVIAEYARHHGRADLLRERIDGDTGYRDDDDGGGRPDRADGASIVPGRH
ncbi:hypothetical protein [Actinoallomurus acaciae]|uniref:DUF664 domain-containing protein n=1 Tax=Actinoallomurus acaciae TaxID=502577 RepID=A0ABV5YJ57_9ACTN